MELPFDLWVSLAATVHAKMKEVIIIIAPDGYTRAMSESPVMSWGTGEFVTTFQQWPTRPQTRVYPPRRHPGRLCARPVKVLEEFNLSSQCE